MTTVLRESGSRVEAKNLGNGIYEAKILQAGWGSSGYYSVDLLREHGPATFKAGRPCFANHPTEEEFAQGRDITKIMAKLVSDAEFREDDNSLVAKIRVNEKWQPFVDEYMDVIGMSIFASGELTEGEAEGRSGKIVESFDPSFRYTSVDFVVAPGAGGKVERMLESYRAISEDANASETPNRKDAGMTPEEIKAAVVEAITPLIAELKEAVKPAPAEDEPVVEGATAAEVAEAVREANLTAVTEKRVFAALPEGASLEDVKAVIEAEKKYAEDLTKNLTEAADGGRVRVVESNKDEAPRRVSVWSN